MNPLQRRTFTRPPIKSGTNPVAMTNDRQRGIVQAAKAKYPKEEGWIVTPGFLRVEQAISNGKPRYQFAVTKDSNSDTVTEVKLDRNDKFLVSHVGIFLMKRLSTLTGIEVLQTYPNVVAIPDDSTNFLCAHLEAFYNGFFGIQVGQTVYIEKMDTRRFRSVEEAIESATITKSSARENSGFVQLTPQFELDGDGKTLISIEAPIHASAKVANTVSNTTNYLVLMFRGFLITKR
jgi:hypothetical protein